MRIIARLVGRVSVVVSNLRRVICCVGAAIVGVGAMGDSVPAGTVADIEERTQPFGQLCLEGDDCGGVDAAAPVVVQAGRSGSEVYAQHCKLCHETGVSDAPKVGDAQAWEPRLAKGMDELLRSTREGLNQMPAGANCEACTDEEYRASIEYMAGISNDGG